MSDILLVTAGVLGLYFAAWFVLAIARNRYDVVDIAWGGAFIVVAWTLLAYNSDQPYYAQVLLTILVTIWGLRLSYHIFKRNWSRPEDARYTALRKNWKGPQWLNALVRIFVLQAVLVLLISAPIIAVASSDTVFNSDLILTLGFAIWASGFAIETFADRQLRQFIALKSKKKILDKGLWRYSRHPNYFGEAMLWWGVWVISLSINPVWWSIVGPLTTTALVLFVSGVPILEKRYAKDKDYQRYATQTSKFVPLPPRKGEV